MEIDFKALVDRAANGVAIYDPKGTLIYFNEALTRIMGTELDARLGESVYKMAEKGVCSSFPAITSLEKRLPASARSQHKDGAQIFCSAMPVFAENGKTLRYVVTIVRDVSQNNFFEDELRQSLIRLATYQEELLELKMAGKTWEEDGLIAVSPQMQDIMRIVYRLASSDVTVLLLGESGVGKNAVARHIHRSGPRRDLPFICVNCGALPQELVESELFGHEKGSFTGAVMKKAGLFEAVGEGTLVLDEVGDLPSQLQVKLLTALQERSFRRVGGVHAIPCKARIIATTNKDLEQMVKEGSFRSDLYYRLNTIALEIPPLRKRQADILHQAAWFLDKLNLKNGTLKKLAPETADLLQGYPWPGNTRELEHVMERLQVLSLGDLLTPNYLPDSFHASPEGHGAKAAETRIPCLQEALEREEKRILGEARRRYGSVRSMAKVLKVSYATISRKLHRYGIE